MSQAKSIDPHLLFRSINAAGVTHVITVPDTQQRTLLDLLAETASPCLITACTEDEAIGINAGLYAGGARPMLLIQNNGFYACINTLKAISLDARVPTFMLIGEHGRDVALASQDGGQERSVRMLEPTLELWEVPYYRLEVESDLDAFPVAYEKCLEEAGPLAMLVGASTGPLDTAMERQ